MTTNKTKIIVIDDDPTGSQTVHSCLLLTKWDVETLKLGLLDESPIFFILSNTRALTPEQAATVMQEVTHNLTEAIAQSNIQDFLVVSRSDSTLRGHYPIETDVIAAELGQFDAHFLVPAFFEAGRVTRNSTHYLMVDGVETPVHKTEFAKDSVFGYTYSYLPDYVEEKTKGQIKAETVERFTLDDIRSGSLERLMKLSGNQCGVVDGETQADLDSFANDLLLAASLGKKFLLRSAASILTSLAALGPQPLAAEEMRQYVRSSKPGVILVGSHVKKSTQQLERLLQESEVVGVEVNVSHLVAASPEQSATLLKNILEKVNEVHAGGRTPVIYTSREELTFENVQVRLEFGAAVSELLMDIVRGLPEDIGFLISKGGITSNDTLSKGLALTTARLLGQVLAGCSMVRTPANHPKFPELPVVLFPGNVGDVDGLVIVYQGLSRS